MMPSDVGGLVMTGFLVICACHPAANAVGEPKVYRGPMPVLLFRDSKRVVGLGRRGEGAAVYRIADGAVVQRFAEGLAVTHLAMAPDEGSVLVGYLEGTLLWDVRAQRMLWQRRASEDGVVNIHDVNFAQGGKRCVICADRKVVVVDSSNGQRIGVVALPVGQDDARSACLSRDGQHGYVVAGSTRLLSMDVISGQATETGLVGAGPVCYSVDDHYVAFRSENAGFRERLKIFRVDAKRIGATSEDLGHIGRIRAGADGSFLISAELEERKTVVITETFVVGVRVKPDTGVSERLWKIASGRNMNWLADFNSQTKIGAATDYHWITRVADLGTGDTLATIDPGRK